MGYKEKKGLFQNKNKYLFVLIAGTLGGVALYHLFGKTIDSVWNKVPVLENYHSHFALSNIGSDL